jgi:glycosyltransferase involved in cell wall biosynthesis
MLFSIVVPVYKVEEYLDRCVESLVKQSYGDIEIILVDDGSPDTCPAMCDSWAERDSRIKVIHKPNGGLSDARNTGVRAASGEYIVFVDSDDCIEFDSCEALKCTIEAKGRPDIISINGIKETGEVFVNSENKHIPQNPIPGKEYLAQALKYGFYRTEAQMSVYRRMFLVDNSLDFARGLLHEDAEFVPRAYFLAGSAVHEKKYIYKYTINPNSIMHSKDYRKNCSDIYKIGLQHENDFKNKADKKLYKYLMDFLVIQYLSIFNMGRCSRYGKDYIHKKFVLRNSHKIKTKIHALAFSVSPKLYSFLINRR